MMASDTITIAHKNPCYFISAHQHIFLIPVKDKLGHVRSTFMNLRHSYQLAFLDPQNHTKLCTYIVVLSNLRLNLHSFLQMR